MLSATTLPEELGKVFEVVFIGIATDCETLIPRFFSAINEVGIEAGGGTSACNVTLKASTAYAWLIDIANAAGTTAGTVGTFATMADLGIGTLAGPPLSRFREVHLIGAIAGSRRRRRTR